MDLTRLLYFRAVVEAGGLARAAPLLRITPGSLSKALRRLEEEVGYTLFVPYGRTRELTAQGRALYTASGRLAKEYERLRQAGLPDPHADDTPLRVATFEPFATHFLGALLAGTGAHQAVDAALVVSEVGLGEIERQVAAGTADVGITYAPYPSRTLHFEPLGEVMFGIYARVGAFVDTPFDALPFAAPVTRLSGGAVRMLAADGWPYGHVGRYVRYHVTSMESALELTRRGLCALFLPGFVAGHHNATVRPGLRLERRKGPPALRPVRHTAHLVTSAERRGDPRLQAFGRAALRALRQGARSG